MVRETTTVIIEKTSTLAKAKGVLMAVAYRFRNRHGEWKENTREVYDNGNSSVVLPYDPDRGTILLTRQENSAFCSR
jgi:GDP-mannose pyrophosphatase NudK